MTSVTLQPRQFLDVLRLGSAALPIGAFAYSQGLESAVSHGHVSDSDSAARWIAGLVADSLLTADLPLLCRLYAAWHGDHTDEVVFWNATCRAFRGTRELRAEDDQLGGSLMRLMSRLGSERAKQWLAARTTTLPCAFALFAVERGIDRDSAVLAYAFAWTESQVGAATRLVPLGQTDAQRVLSAALDVAAAGMIAALELPDERMSATTVGQSILSSQHETEYSRLFRS